MYILRLTDKRYSKKNKMWTIMDAFPMISISSSFFSNEIIERINLIKSDNGFEYRRYRKHSYSNICKRIIYCSPSIHGRGYKNTAGENDTVYYCDLVFRTIRKSISLLNIVIELLKLGMILAEIYVVCGFCNFAIYSMRL